MALLTVLSAPDPRLRMKAKPIKEVDDSIRKFMDDMLETMLHDKGGGLAAVQVGVDKRVIVMQIEPEYEGDGKLYFMANPEIVWSSSEKKLWEEGCLSVPGIFIEVERAEKVKVKFLDRDNKERELDLDGRIAECVQHEIEHLDGILTIDHLSAIKRKIVLKKLQKNKLQQVSGS
ncbi:MAG: peptide deformylase [Alphaproteobacteria bacterium]|jgi:peptide deformylase|nr:peptide deformylase [Alphaproteobacteria bacterium]MBT5389442.1 peptide deformylase [Alphaproteobacteria bacterium]MBT5541169.1 peptide deformylase [Alphaproteobacteria bacterium]MBT5654996.1 peptide deformylase [Alphaproteobacteria bacterium]